MALTTGGPVGGGNWGVGRNGGYVWYGPGPAPQMTANQIAQSWGVSGALPASRQGGYVTPLRTYSAGPGSAYTGTPVTTQPVGQQTQWQPQQTQQTQQQPLSVLATGTGLGPSIPPASTGGYTGPSLQAQQTQQQPLSVLATGTGLGPSIPPASTGGYSGPSLQAGQTQQQPLSSLSGLSDYEIKVLQQLKAAGLSPEQVQQMYQNSQLSNPTSAPGAPQYGLSGAEAALQGGLQGGIAGLEAGVNQATGTLSPYTSGGGAAYNLQAALSGALGPQAQAQAFANYNQSPEMAYALDQAEKAITRNASATGGRQSGNVLQALQRNAIGMAQQDYGNAFNRLGQLSGMGLGASGQLAGIQSGAGSQAGQMAYGTGGQLANYRTRAGEQIAGNYANTSQGLANLINQQGGALSGLIGNQGNAIANLLAAYGQADAQTQQQLATLLANIATGSASQASGLPPLPQAGTGGWLDSAGNFIGGVAQLFKR